MLASAARRSTSVFSKLAGPRAELASGWAKTYAAGAALCLSGGALCFKERSVALGLQGIACEQREAKAKAGGVPEELAGRRTQWSEFVQKYKQDLFDEPPTTSGPMFAGFLRGPR